VTCLVIPELPKTVIYQFCAKNTGGTAAGIKITVAALGLEKSFASVAPGETVCVEKEVPYNTDDCGRTDLQISVSAGASASATCTCGPATADCGASVKVQFPACPKPTRTPGYWSTHPQALKTQIDCCKPWAFGCATANYAKDALALMRDSISSLRNGNSRSALGQARMQLAQQLTAAYANVCAFGAVPPVSLSAVATAMSGTNKDVIIGYVGQLSAFNSSGDSVAFPPGFVQTAADPATAGTWAALSTITQWTCFK
jgi:hypothetical protein